MRRLRRPDLWFLVTLLVVVVIGAGLLARADATDSDSRRLSYSRHHWQAAFDALSATCGVGLLTYGFQEDYTPRGRWILTALGVIGALLFVAAATHAMRRAQEPVRRWESERVGKSDRISAPLGHPLPSHLPTCSHSHARVPHPVLAVSAFIIVQTLVLGIFLLASWIGEGTADRLETGPTVETAWSAIAAFSSLGWASEIVGDRLETGPTAWPLALMAWLGALGWPVWLLIVPALSRRYVRVRATLALLGAYALMLLSAALLISAFESPRGAVGRGGPSDDLSGQPWPTRYARSLVQTVAASGAGTPTESLEGADATPGTKVTLAALLLIGGLGGSTTGGVQCLVLLWAFGGAAAALGWSGRGDRNPEAARWMRAGLACVLLLALLAFVVAIGMLLLENWTASRYQPPPAFADAWLDACSLVAGGNLSTGLTDTVTGRNLLSGIRQSANLYQHGMIWLMLAMLAGRVLPLVVLSRLANDRADAS